MFGDMGKYTVLSDVSRALVDLLRDEMVPEPIAKPEQIGICGLQERGSFVVGLTLYNFQENGENRRNDFIELPDGRRQKPPVEYSASYLLTIVSKAEPDSRGMDEQRIMGRTLQVLQDNRRMPPRFLSDALREHNEAFTIEVSQMSMEDKMKIWNMLNEPYKLCCFFDVRPILMESTVILPAPKRVTEVTLESKQIPQNGK